MRFFSNRLLIGGLATALLATSLAGCGGGKRRNPVAAPADRPEKTENEAPASEANARIRAALDRGDAKTAERLARARIAAHPADGEAHRLLARALSEQKKPSGEVRQALEKAEALQPGDAAGRRDLAAMLDRQAQEAISADDPDKAIPLWKRCLALKFKPRQTEKQLAEAYRRQGEQRAAAGKPADAEKSFREAVSLLPDNPVPRLDLARLLMDGDRLVEAQRELKELTDAHPNFEAGLVAYAHLLRRMGDVRGATKQVERVLEYAPGNPEALALQKDLANTVPIRQAAEPAAAAFDEPDPDTLRELTRLESAGDPAAQQAFLESYLAAHPEASWAKLRQAMLYERQGKPEDAMALLETYLAGSPEDFRARFLHARCLLATGRTADALSALKALEADNRANHQVQDEMGQAYAKLGRFNEARTAWKRIIEANPTFAPSLFNLGQLAMEQGLADEARDWFDQALRQEPANPKFRYFAGLNLKQAGMEPEARAVWESGKAYLTPSDPYATRIAAALGKPLPPAAAAAPALSPLTRPPAIEPPAPVSPVAAAQPTSVGGVVVQPVAPAASDMADPGYQAALEAARAGQYADAVTGFQEVLERYPAGFNARMNLGNVYMATNRPGEAAAQYLHAVRLEKNNSNALRALSRAYDELGLRGHAAGLAARADGKENAGGAATTRSNPRAFEPVTTALLSNGLPEEALAIINAGVAENPDSPDLVVLQGDVLTALRQDAQAETVYRRALTLDAQNPAPMIRLGNLYAGRQQTDAAIAQYQAALKSPLIDPDGMFSIADQFVRLGRRTEATEVLNRLKGMNLSEAQLAKLHERTGTPAPASAE
ncbi:MAG TPA: tetratricopeptide repeat protein [Candidatus Ozemobacteraceae bacterium]|nr:tetratricopeptide repeat protein [Candidatus Ozemobacteraceae bacterium]